LPLEHAPSSTVPLQSLSNPSQISDAPGCTKLLLSLQSPHPSVLTDSGGMHGEQAR
jgi:hypothetical protein